MPAVRSPGRLSYRLGGVSPSMSRRLIVLLAILLIPVGVVWAAPRSAYPQFTGARVYASKAPAYADVDRYIERLEKTSKQRYTVVVVKGSGSGDWATRNYCDDLYRHWTQRHPKAERLVHARSMLLVLALENRQLAVRASPLLQKQYGLRGQAVDRNYVRPRFNTDVATPAQLLGFLPRPLKPRELLTWSQRWAKRSIHPIARGSESVQDFGGKTGGKTGGENGSGTAARQTIDSDENWWIGRVLL